MEKILSSVKIEKLRENADINKGCVIAVGNFDGVHKGHRRLLSRLVNESKEYGLPSAVFAFSDRDRPKSGVKQLSQYGNKPLLLGECGVDVLVSAPFSLFRDMEAEDFVLRFLGDFLGVKCVICGYDFRFGRGRKGDFRLIEELLAPCGVSVVSETAMLHGELPISSTLIRELVSKGDFGNANDMLGREFSFVSEVVSGAKLGRTLGFPTANQKYPSELVPPRFGVYAVRCVIDGKRYGGVANFGVKPTVGDYSEPVCETYIFDFDGDCYGKEMETRFVSFIRGEERFNSIYELKARVELDKAAAESILKKENEYE